PDLAPSKKGSPKAPWKKARTNAPGRKPVCEARSAPSTQTRVARNSTGPRRSASRRAEHLVRVDDEFFRHTGIELTVTARGIVQADDLHADHLGDVDAIPHDRLHKRTVVFHHWCLAGVEAVRLGPAEAETDAQAAHFR